MPVLLQAKEKFTEVLHFRESKRILAKVASIAAARGTDCSTLYREAIRYWLADHNQLTEQEMNALGLARRNPTHDRPL